MQDDEPKNSDRHVTKAYLDQALAATKGEFKELFTAHKADMEQLLADQANVILEAVDEKLADTLDQKFDEKLDPVISKLDGIMKGVEALQQENVVGAEQLRRHDDQLNNHERRIKTIELQPQH